VAAIEDSRNHQGRLCVVDAVPHREPLRAHQLIKLGDLTLTSEREGAVHSICLFGELDLATANSVQDELTRVEASDADSIIVDLSGLTFIDSTGIRLLYSAAARSRADSDRLALLRGGVAVQRALQITALEDRLPFAD
jgi:anti-sigma B factor antagonist